MDDLREGDVPCGEDWDDPGQVAAWADAADRKRPWRSQMREHIAGRVAERCPAGRVLELGSGPGFLAEAVLRRCDRLAHYGLLDFSAPMLALARERLRGLPAASFIHASFKSEDWAQKVEGPFDCVLSMQAIHELRHKRHAAQLYRQAWQSMTAPGLLLICDHLPFDDSPTSTALYMEDDEQRNALLDAGFSNVRVDLALEGLVLYHALRVA